MLATMTLGTSKDLAIPLPGGPGFLGQGLARVQLHAMDDRVGVKRRYSDGFNCLRMDSDVNGRETLAWSFEEG